MAKTAEQMSQAYQKGMSNAAAAYTQGINNFQGNPMALAEAANDRFLQKVQESVTSGRRSAALLAVPVSTWKNNAATKGAARLASGAQAAASKVQAHFQKWAPIYANISQTCKAMPKGGIEEAMARVRKNLEMQLQAAGKA